MPPRSKIRTLPKETRARIDAFLAEKERAVDEFLQFLTDDIGLDVGRSAAHRYQQKFEKVASRLRESREMTEALASELGEAATQGKQGRVLVEMARSLVFDMMTKIQDLNDDENGTGMLSPQDVAFLGKGLAELGRALRFDQDFEMKLLQGFAKKAADRAVQAADEQARKSGHVLPPEALKAIREQVYGIVDG